MNRCHRSYWCVDDFLNRLYTFTAISEGNGEENILYSDTSILLFARHEKTDSGRVIVILYSDFNCNKVIYVINKGNAGTKVDSSRVEYTRAAMRRLGFLILLLYIIHT